MNYLGLLNICKAPGMSSHEVVARVRRLAGMKRVGHTGTLDPAACGVLLVCLGSATRLADYVAAGTKAYRAEITFGLTTDSADADGDITGTADASGLDAAAVRAAMQQFAGVIQQRPPMHSAVQIGGRRAYDLARKGETVELPLREVTIEEFSCVRFLPGARPRLLADIICSKGTYIRSLARDLGEALGVGGTMTFLARTRVGDCQLAEAITLDELTAAAQAGEFAACVRPADASLSSMPAAQLAAGDEKYLQGAAVSVDLAPGIYRVYLATRFLGLGRSEEGLLRPVVNLQ